ncbi:MAG: ribose-5-phosphate isomerase [Nigerium sp.]|nr:ribose-5-phosphate isomerase [Nigerium sp.]
MRIHIATDHAAFELKQFLVTELTALGYDVVDHGAYRYDPDDDYPVFVIPAAEAVAAEPGSLGIVLGGSGNGEQIAANKVRGVRAALAFNTVTARLGREHNNANVLSLGGRGQSHDGALAMVKAFVTTSFPGEERHLRRLAMLEAYEARHSAS